MDRELRKRRAAVGALALLNWRNQMAGNADRELMQAKYELMVAAMRVEAEAAAARRRWRSLLAREDLPPVSRASHCS
jgi:hypothetical protein